MAILEEKQVGGDTWGRTDKGWISMAFVRQVGQQTEDPAVRTVSAGCLNVRAEAGTHSQVVAYLYRGARVKILEEKTVGDTQWGRTQQGWIALAYTQ